MKYVLSTSLDGLDHYHCDGWWEPDVNQATIFDGRDAACAYAATELPHHAPLYLVQVDLHIVKRTGETLRK